MAKCFNTSIDGPTAYLFMSLTPTYLYNFQEELQSSTRQETLHLFRNSKLHDRVDMSLPFPLVSVSEFEPATSKHKVGVLIPL